MKTRSFSINHYEKAKILKEKHLWDEARETYLSKNNFYLTSNDYNHSSFVCCVEAVNEVFEMRLDFR